VDGNVKRVLTRLFAITDNISLGTTSRRLRDLAAALLPPGRPGDFNQALMELGAVICTPVSPQCLMCTVREVCYGWVQGIQDMLPVRRERGKLPHHDVAAGVIRRQDGHLLIIRRNVAAMLGGLWGFPGGRCRAGESLPDCLRRQVRAQIGVDVAVDQPLITIRHSYTHFRITLHVSECRYLGGEPQTVDGADWRWLRLEDFADFAFPVTDQKIIARL
jgi:A/G-specific adenine glycosylase